MPLTVLSFTVQGTRSGLISVPFLQEIAKARAKRQTAAVQAPTGEFPVIKRRY